MSRHCRLFFILCLIPFWSNAQRNSPDDIIGYYYSVDPFTDEASQIYIYKNAQGKYDGVVCWVENLAKKKFLNLVFLKELEFNEKENDWRNGIVKYPGKSGTYSMYMKFESSSKLKVRGYWGVSLLGKSMYWYKEEHKRIQK